MKKNKNEFILASASPRRQELLKEQGYCFKIVVPKTKELSKHKISCKDAALENAMTKAIHVAKKNKDQLVLSADTVVVLNAKILAKPRSKKEALKMLLQLNNKTHQVITAYTLLKISKKTTEQEAQVIEKKAVVSRVRFGNFKESEYLNYVNTLEPMDKAGAYAIQGLGARFVRSFTGSYTNIVGLPLFESMLALKKAGIKYPWNKTSKASKTRKQR